MDMHALLFTIALTMAIAFFCFWMEARTKLRNQAEKLRDTSFHYHSVMQQRDRKVEQLLRMRELRDTLLRDLRASDEERERLQRNLDSLRHSVDAYTAHRDANALTWPLGSQMPHELRRHIEELDGNLHHLAVQAELHAKAMLAVRNTHAAIRAKVAKP